MLFGHCQLLLLFLILTATIQFSSSASSFLDYVIKDEITHLDIDRDDHYVKTGEDLNIQCRITRVCLTDYVPQCTDPGTTRWFLPNTLPARDNTTRKQILFDYKVVNRTNANGKPATTLNITTTLRLMKVGFIHEGHYECSSIYEQMLFNLHILENGRQSCELHDQCRSYNCYEGKCQCKEGENYDSATKKCVTRALLGGRCTSDIECSIGHQLNIDPEFREHFAATKCNSTKLCQCEANSVQVNLATATIDACLPKASLGTICYSSAQCQSHPGDGGAFCGLDLNAAAAGKQDSSSKTSPTTSSSSGSSQPSTFQLVCQCKDGWHPMPGNTSCAAYAHCDSSSLGFNEHYLPGSCAGPNQFCRDNYCLCIPNYEFNSDGGCVKQRGLDESKPWYAEYYREILLSLLAVTLILALLGLIHLILQKFVFKKRKQPPPPQQPPTAPAQFTIRSNVNRTDIIRQTGKNRY